MLERLVGTRITASTCSPPPLHGDAETAGDGPFATVMQNRHGCQRPAQRLRETLPACKVRDRHGENELLTTETRRTPAMPPRMIGKDGSRMPDCGIATIYGRIRRSGA